MSTTKKIILTTISVVILGAGGYFIFSGDGNSDNEKITVTTGDISEVVRVTGKTKPMADAELAFEVSGSVKAVYRDVGDVVETGSLIATLDTGVLSADLADALAQLDSYKASLLEAQSGTRPEQIAVSEAKVTSSESALVDAQAQLRDKLRDSYTKVDDAIRNKVDQFIDNPKTDPDLQLSFSDQAAKNQIESQRLSLNATLDELVVLVNAISPQGDLLTDSEKIKVDVLKVKQFLDNVALAVNSLTTSSSVSQTTIDGYKADVLTARTNVNTALSNILSFEEKVRSAQTALLVAQKDLKLLQAGSTTEQIAVAEANVKKAEASVQRIRVNLAKTSLRSPIDGVITQMDAKVGQVAVANSVIASVISQGNLEIEVQVPEVDIGRVVVGNTVDITVDAFPGEKFTGKVAYIDPAETIIDGVVNYKATVLFDNEDERLRSGLTVNLFIQTVFIEDAIVIPQFTVIEKDEGTFVQKDVNGERVETKITIGVRGEGGMLEVTSGLSKGDTIYNIGLKKE